jgi:hypothetical protein
MDFRVDFGLITGSKEIPLEPDIIKKMVLKIKALEPVF